MYTENFFEDTITPDARLNGNGKPIVQITATNILTLSNSNVFNFNYHIGSHNNIDGVLGQELTVMNTKNSISRVLNYSPGIDPSKAIGVLSLGTLQAGYPQTSEVEESRLSFFGRVNYDYDRKYLLSVTLRSEASSKFSPDNRWGYFPSASVGWRIFNENFMKNVSFLSDLKIRAGFGVTGNDKILDYQYLSSFSATSIYGLGNGSVVGYQPSLSNPNLKWETNTTRNIGFDAAFLKNRLTLTMDVYRNTGTNLLINVPVPTSVGYPPTSGASQPVQTQNIGGVTNQGLEISMTAVVMQKKDFSWNANFNISFNHNNIDRISPLQNSYLDNSGALTGQSNDYIVKVGSPVGSMYGYVTQGMYQVSDFNAVLNTSTGKYVYTLKPGVADNSSVAGQVYPGTVKFKDVSGPGGKPDGVIDANNDRTIIGSAQPKFTGGFNQTFIYKGFDASVFVNFVYGNNILNANKLEFTNSFTPDANVLSIMNDRWKYIDATGNVVTDPVALATMNAHAKLWVPSQGTGATAFALHSWAVEDGSFLRLNNVSIGYTIPGDIMRRAKISKLRIYVTGSNLGIATHYSGYDPEVNSRRSSGTTPGVDYSAYPRARSILFGMNLTF
jgi:TonB-linked SusC/RagA family outer membrane protein